MEEQLTLVVIWQLCGELICSYNIIVHNSIESTLNNLDIIFMDDNDDYDYYYYHHHHNMASNLRWLRN